MRESLGNMSDTAKSRIEDHRRLIDRYEDLLSNGIRGIAVLNSAGVVATLGFIQALISKPSTYLAFKSLRGIRHHPVPARCGRRVGRVPTATRRSRRTGPRHQLGIVLDPLRLHGPGISFGLFVVAASAVVIGLLHAT